MCIHTGVYCVYIDTYKARSSLEADKRFTEDEVKRLHPQRKKVATDEWKSTVYACKCNYDDNRWFILVSCTKALQTEQLRQFH